MDPNDRPIEDIQASNAFRRTLVERADDWKGPAPLWHGWALMDAFLAGIDHAQQPPTERQMHEGAYMYSMGHWGMFPVVYIGFLPICSAG